MAMKPALALALALAACSRGSTGPDTGADAGCVYRTMEGTCRLAAIRRNPISRRGIALVEVDYVPASGNFSGPIAAPDVEYEIPDSMVDALRAHLESHREVPCRARTLVRGPCPPYRTTVDVPPFAPARLR
jgi:hypothetical protein